MIVACLNAKNTVRKCLQSVMSQESSLAELIVMDGGSTDGTLEILREFHEKFAHFESKRDGGVYRAWNAAVPHTRGEWVYFLGSDDYLWTSDALLRISAGLRAVDSRTSIVYGQVVLLDNDGAQVTVVGRPWVETSRRFFRGGNLYHQGVFHRRSLFASHHFDTSFPILADYDFLLNVLSGAPPSFEPVIVAGYRAGGMSNRPRNALRTVHEVGRALKKNGHPRNILSALMHYVRTLGWVALLGAASVVSKKAWRFLSRLLIRRAAREA